MKYVCKPPHEWLRQQGLVRFKNKMCGFLYGVVVIASNCLIYWQLTAVCHWTPFWAAVTSLLASLLLDLPFCLLLIWLVSLAYHRDSEKANKHLNEMLLDFHAFDTLGAILCALFLLFMMVPILQRAKQQSVLRARATPVSILKH